MNKPMVFLSHSKKDISFIHRLETDLRRSGIDTWLDEIDIRHGESWLNEIFEHGIAKCDFVLVYITENSLASAMVAKEIDSTLVNQLREGRVKLLIYVDSDSTREKLRYDLQSLHCPTLDDNSYAQVFPVVISTIWSNYTNLVVSKVIAEKDLEIENLKLREELHLQKKSIMAEVDEEFEFIFKELSAKVKVNCKFKLRNVGDEASAAYTMNRMDLLQGVYNNLNGAINAQSINSGISRYLRQRGPSEFFTDKYDVDILADVNFMESLITFGFVVRNFNPKPQSGDSRIHLASMFHSYEIFLKSEKFDRFMLWTKLKKKEIDRSIEEIANA
jgi:hypothetical protein